MSIAKLISDFITDSAKSSTPIADLLEQARTIACIIDDNDFAKFCEKELNGYDEEDKAPNHRLVEAITQSWYDGPLKKTDAPNIGTNVASTEFFRKSIKFICELLNEKKDFEEFFKWPNDPQKDLYKNRIIVKRHYLQRIESEVRRQINEWKSLKIKEGKFPLELENNSFDFETLKQLIIKIEADLADAKNIEAEKADYFKELITLLKNSAENRNRTSAMDLLQQLVVGATSSGIWSIGTTISTFLSSLG